MLPHGVTITQVGPYPPPYGGVSTHVHRLRLRLQNDGYHVPIVCDAHFSAQGEEISRLPRRGRPSCYLGWLLDGRVRFSPGIVHFHELRGYSFLLRATVARSHPVAVTVHNQFMLEQHGFFASLSRWAVRRVGRHPRCRFIAVNDRIREQLQGLGVPAARISVIPAFLPLPTPPRIEDLPERIRSFGAGHRPLLSVYGLHCARLPEGGDLYGFELSIRALAEVRRRHPDAGLVILTPGNAGKPYFRELQALAEEMGVLGAVHWEDEAMPDATRLWKFSDVYLRPTTTDGDALAVREALAVGTPVVASDASERPLGCSLFPSLNVSALASEILTTLTRRGNRNSSLGKCGYAAVKRVYGELLD